MPDFTSGLSSSFVHVPFGRGIPAGGVAPRSNTPGILARRALPSGRRAPKSTSQLTRQATSHDGLRRLRLRWKRGSSRADCLATLAGSALGRPRRDRSTSSAGPRSSPTGVSSQPRRMAGGLCRHGRPPGVSLRAARDPRTGSPIRCAVPASITAQYSDVISTNRPSRYCCATAIVGAGSHVRSEILERKKAPHHRSSVHVDFERRVRKRARDVGSWPQRQNRVLPAATAVPAGVVPDDEVRRAVIVDVASTVGMQPGVVAIACEHDLP